MVPLKARPRWPALNSQWRDGASVADLKEHLRCLKKTEITGPSIHGIMLLFRGVPKGTILSRISALKGVNAAKIYRLHLANLRAEELERDRRKIKT